MCREMDRIYSEGMEAGEKLGELKARQEMTRALAAMGISAEKIARAVKASPEVIQEWLAKELPPVNEPEPGEHIFANPQQKISLENLT